MVGLPRLRSSLTTVYIVPAWSDQAGQCCIVSRPGLSLTMKNASVASKLRRRRHQALPIRQHSKPTASLAFKELFCVH